MGTCGCSESAPKEHGAKPWSRSGERIGAERLLSGSPRGLRDRCQGDVPRSWPARRDIAIEGPWQEQPRKWVKGGLVVSCPENCGSVFPCICQDRHVVSNRKSLRLKLGRVEAVEPTVEEPAVVMPAHDLVSTGEMGSHCLSSNKSEHIV